MKADTKKRKRRIKDDHVSVSTIDPKSDRRKTRGYVWEVSTRIGGKRVSRKFFKQGQAGERDEYKEEQEKLIEQHGREEKEQAIDTGLQKELTAALELLKPWDATLSEAAKFYADYLEAKANEDSATIEQAFTAYIEAMQKRKLNVKTITRARQTIRRFSDSFPDRTLASLCLLYTSPSPRDRG